MDTDGYVIKDCGEQALSVDFGESVDPEKHARILALESELWRRRPAGLRETAPSYRALIAHYDPLVLSREDLAACIALCAHPAESKTPASEWTIPCCYAPEAAEDLAEAAALARLTPEALAATHAAGLYRAYMYGFAPGYCYLGGLPPALAISRRPSPRPPCPAQSVLIGGGLGLIATCAMPTGWYVIGRTPERLFAPERMRPFFLDVGDAVRFAPISILELQMLNQRAQAGEIISRKTR